MSRTVRVDMHVHTSASFDSLSDPVAAVESAVARGIDRVCVTDHDTVRAALHLKERFPDRVIVGEEVKTAEGADIIGLYLREPIPRGTPALDTCHRIRDQGGLVYVPHPFAGRKGGARLLHRIAGWIDVVEGFNARVHSRRLNARGAEWARDRGLPLGAGSDAHTLREVGRAFAELPPFDDEPSAFLAALRQARLYGRSSSRLVHAASTYARIRKRWSARRSR